MTARYAPCALGLLFACTAVGGCFDPGDEIDEGGSTGGMTGSDPTMPTDPSSPSTDPATSGTDPSDPSDPSTTTTNPSDPSTTTNPTDPTDDSSGTSTDEESSSSGEPSDTEAPSVLSVAPAQSATGIFADRSITVTFSEPMDEDSVAAALDASLLGAVTTSWNDDATVLTIDPNEDLAYATGSSPIDVEAIEFQFIVSTAATDLAGNALGEPFESNFFTLRELTFELGHDPAYTGGVVGSTGVVQTGSGDDPIVGDHSDNDARRGFMGFAITPLPNGIVEFVSAELRANQWLVLGDPIPGLGDEVMLHHIAPELLPGGAYGSAAIDEVGVWSDEDSYASDNTKSADVTSNVEYDYENGETHCQFRLQLDSPTNYNSTTDRLRYNGEVLEVRVLVP